MLIQYIIQFENASRRRKRRHSVVKNILLVYFDPVWNR
jgi:hypothetical protein